MHPKGNSGYCTTCDQASYFIERGPWLRDEYVCLPATPFLAPGR